MPPNSYIVLGDIEPNGDIEPKGRGPNTFIYVRQIIFSLPLLDEKEVRRYTQPFEAAILEYRGERLTLVETEVKKSASGVNKNFCSIPWRGVRVV